MSSEAASFSEYLPDHQRYSISTSIGEIRVVDVKSGSICLLCKGGKLLCGRLRCPLIAKAASLAKFHGMIDSNLVEGATPPGVFVGRIGYPKVYIGPMVPPFHGDTAILDSPEMWMGKSIDEIIDLRYSLIRGKMRFNVEDVRTGSKYLDIFQELAMGERSVESEALFKSKPEGTLKLSESSQPFGPSALLKDFRIENIRVDSKIERAYYDRGLKASETLIHLYHEGVPVSRIHRGLSAGLFGLGESRRLVPTRWSITAVDDTLSKDLVGKIRGYRTIDEYRVYSYYYLDNIYVVMLMPSTWSFEWIEAWFPGTTWNVNGLEPEMIGDYEGYKGRTRYAEEIGGCYYAARLAASEALARESRQASVLALREIHKGYTLPVGVWNVRESLRRAMKTRPRNFDDLNPALKHSLKMLTIPLKHWLLKSRLLRDHLYQRRLDKHLHGVHSDGN